MNQTYIVKPGDTLYGISNQYGVSVTDLANINNIKGSNLQIGTELIIPTKSGINPNNMFMYTVQKGDTLYKIAQKYNTTIDAIMKINYFTNSNLTIGQVIRIPETYTKEEELYLPNYTNYTVKNGDTLYSIARDNDVKIETIIKDNALTSNNLSIGQNLKIRMPVMVSSEIEECYGPDYNPPQDIKTEEYIVKKGDNLYSIARQYNTNVSTLINLNNLSNASIVVGQKLKIPTSNNNQTYIVKKGDSLYTIARLFNTTVDSLKRKNNLASNNLSIGQKLII